MGSTNPAFIAVLAAVGLIAGSIVTMVVDRVPDGLSLVRPRPRCPLCEHPIAFVDLVPVLSWFALRGECRNCHERVTPAYPAVEIVCGAAFAAAAWRIGWNLNLVPCLVFFAVLIAVSTVDLYEYLIPNRILFPAIGLSLALITAGSLSDGRPERIGWALCGMVAYGAVLGLPALIRPDKLGLGDAKLALYMGLHLGWFVEYLWGIRLVMISLVLGCLFGVLSGVGLFVARKATGRELLADPEAAAGAPSAGLFSMAFPFGPALALGSMLGLLFWQPLLGL